MERQEFLKTLGISFAAVCVGSCISACGKDNEATPAPPAGTFVNANLSELSAIGAKVIVSGVAFFRITEGDTSASFIATQPLCTHQEGILVWGAGTNFIQCQRHGAKFTAEGVNFSPPQGGGTATNLKTYTITVANGMVTAKIA